MIDVQKIKYDICSEKVQYLMSTDIRLHNLIQSVGSCELQLEKDGFKCLVKYIVGQQISDKARETIWNRMQSITGGITANNIYKTDIKEIQLTGISERKSRYIKELSTSIVDGNIIFTDIIHMTNEQIIKKLTALKGIGQWTAEMYLIFSLGRENVLSSGDGTIKRVTQWLYELKELPTSKEVIEIFEKWKGYETIVSAYFWATISSGIIKRSIGQMKF